jgi:hemerythrin-like metal-binding protein
MSGEGGMSANLVPNELLTGVAEMDSQHDLLFTEMQRVKHALLAVAEDHDEGLALLSQLAEDLDAHFAWEEEAARANGIPFAGHTREHARIAAFVRAKISEISSGGCNIPALMVFMERQFETHVVHYDLKLATELRRVQTPA